MDLKLNIYEKRKIIKTYTAETYDLMFGTVEDLLDVMDIDNIQADNRTELLKAVAKVLAHSMDIVKPLLKDVFEGLTDEELRNTKISEIVDALSNIVTYSINQITKGNNGKN
jgi:Zn-dependent M32 family carboxypeptidase